MHLFQSQCWHSDRQADAERSLRWLRGAHYDVDKELSQLIVTAKVPNEQNAKFTEMLRWSAARPVLVAVGLMFSQQLSGINAVVFFTVNIFTAAGSDLDPAVSTVIIQCVDVSRRLSSIIISTLFFCLNSNPFFFRSSVLRHHLVIDANRSARPASFAADL